MSRFEPTVAQIMKVNDVMSADTNELQGKSCRLTGLYVILHLNFGGSVAGHSSGVESCPLNTTPSLFLHLLLILGVSGKLSIISYIVNLLHLHLPLPARCYLPWKVMESN